MNYRTDRTGHRTNLRDLHEFSGSSDFVSWTQNQTSVHHCVDVTHSSCKQHERVQTNNRVISQNTRQTPLCSTSAAAACDRVAATRLLIQTLNPASETRAAAESGWRVNSTDTQRPKSKLNTQTTETPLKLWTHSRVSISAFSSSTWTHQENKR